ncbi:MAG: FAD-binding protein [Frankiales bacterium]|nr:FAD-binding protein [Frankiales bacterium]
MRADLAAVVGEEHVLTDPGLVAPHVVDWSRRFGGPALAVVRPADTAQVAAVVRRCARDRVPLLPQGGNTGLVGGSVPGPDGPAPVIVSTRRLTRLDPVDALQGQVTVGAGVLLADVQRHARAAGWEYGVDLAARDSATIGGTIGTNAGGIRVCCYGMTRRQVVGIEAVLPDGSVVEHLAGLPKDNTGYDLVGLLVGSEGTLGVVTAARLALVRPPLASSVALVAVRDADDALALVDRAVPTGVRLLAAEILDAAMLRHVVEVSGLPMPVADDAAHVLLVETESAERGEVALNLPDDRDAIVAVDAVDRARLWSYRERAAEAASALGVPHRFDVSVPLGGWDAFVADMKQRLASVDDVAEVLVFGHLADGNLHVEVLGPDPEDERSDAVVLRTVADHGGSISAEHGVGRAKAPYLHLTRSPQEIAAMRAVKSAFDPHGLFNPGALLA